MSPDDCWFHGSGRRALESVEKLPLISVGIELGLNYWEWLLCALRSGYLQGEEGCPWTAPGRRVVLPARMKQATFICPCTHGGWVYKDVPSLHWNTLRFLNLGNSGHILAEMGRESKPLWKFILSFYYQACCWSTGHINGSYIFYRSPALT